MEKYLRLRYEHPEFIYHGFDITDRGFSYHFSIDETHFYPEWEWSGLLEANVERNTLETLVFSLGMAELVSYWKCACPPTVRVKCGALNDERIRWWKKLYFNGLGEFFYRNGISANFDDFMEIIADYEQSPPLLDPSPNRKGALIPVGGGKDSVVTLELLSGTKKDNLCYFINPRRASSDCARLAGYGESQILIPRRRIDKTLLQRNAEGWLNGHTPFSAIVAFSSYLAAFLTGRRYIALSNESSANEANVDGTTVNHQYSKSTEFERDFRKYCQKFLLPSPEYFSLLRPWSEWQITKKFVSYDKYLDVFQSCNVGSKTDTWCGECAKCLYVFIMLSAFLDDERLVKIFGSNMLGEERFSELFDGLVYADRDKPFECVGTRNEIRLALYRAGQRRKNGKLPRLLKKYLDKNPEEPEALDDYFDKENFVPPALLPLLSTNGEKAFRAIERFFCGKKVLILGFGREGRSTLGLLRNIDCTVGIADKNLAVTDEIKDLALHGGENYLDAMADYDIIMKSPGVPLLGEIPEEIKKKITGQTDLLLRFCPNPIVGITGTKGKSTTSSLIFHFLKNAGKDALLVGNIGVPPLECLGSLRENTIVVCEMSCHQLEYVHASPRVGVYLNLFEEHLDHYNSFADYARAKENIWKYQSADDLLIAEKALIDPAIGSRVVSASLSEKADISLTENGLFYLGKSIPFSALPTRLIGRHNYYNIGIAMRAAAAFGCTEEEMERALPSFYGLPHRLESVGFFGGAEYINDSISTCPSTTIAAVRSFDRVDTLIIGGMDRGIDYGELVDFINKSAIEHVVLLPDSGHKLADRLDPQKRAIYIAKDLADAVRYAKKVTKIRCLLSPAAASYGFYKNFEERGEHFRKLCSEE
ncbi:MAG: UDP-N-acetylmuramoyl-L-alanine--D-glutamate ligase [Bacteroides sp.]|nr:UDP-N-acetylmuramoyl-L-alanine--D-glutamate ligase [Eubacterium sp.]MCM1418060.1 UDP-N-acetylmuramoyl-L-alanine--D-glutamate ligase [Roseburia sp.]MCM1462204.1 UDP-N-acetylmuramoyl-L-alanine--D-glutamate ligase [Bacteroides sp.]